MRGHISWNYIFEVYDLFRCTTLFAINIIEAYMWGSWERNSNNYDKRIFILSTYVSHAVD